MSPTPTEHTARNALMWLVHTACICDVKLNNNESKLWQQINLKQKKKLNTFRCHNWVSKQPRHPGHKISLRNLFIHDTLFEMIIWVNSIQEQNWYFVLWIFDFWQLQRCNSASWPPKPNFLLLGVCVCAKSEYSNRTMDIKTTQVILTYICLNTSTFFLDSS